MIYTFLFVLLAHTVAGARFIVTLEEEGAAVWPSSADITVTSLDPYEGRVLLVDTDLSLKSLSRVEGVVSVEREEVVSISDEIFVPSVAPSWGVDRIDGAMDGNVVRSPKAGQGVDIYILDTGVYAGHNEFKVNRVDRGFDATQTNDASKPGDTDCHGHGTHVASTAAGLTYGVAPFAKIVPVKVLSCSGTGFTGSVINGINWALAQKGGNMKVISMSIGGPKSQAMDSAVKKARDAGVLVSVAAGNSNTNACNFSPAGAEGAVTVGSTTATDTRSSFSNYGTCVNIFAPGSGIRGAAVKDKTASTLLSGTSMACPHVSGVLAVLRSIYPLESTQSIVSRMVLWSEKGVVKLPGTGSPNLFLRNWGDTSGPTPQPSPSSTPRPTASGGTGCDGVTDGCMCNSVYHCWWDSLKGCIHRNTCDHDKKACRNDKQCTWLHKKCLPV